LNNNTASNEPSGKAIAQAPAASSAVLSQSFPTRGSAVHRAATPTIINATIASQSGGFANRRAVLGITPV
jgi:hypothetical protein